ncbi:DUF3048 domain-containing protein [Leifsonia sp. Leaf264]|uniref:DUF3048 domain-containing protein n=1 Tax=Leifsonia sp. Leaf264 TaxID=1736314 RepID=UPI0009E7FDB6|nr:DUF3048 domain-containing protein [Leifsonia sp. Leaf264]
MRRRVVLSTIIVLPMLLLAAGCTAAPPKKSASPTPTEPAYVSTYEAPAATEIAPLRGTTVPAGSLAHPSLAAKIDNHEEARPQYGLDRTDIVFEELVEGGLTRYAAVWQSDVPDEIGPVRSIRPMDPDIISPFGGIIAYSGGQQIFVDMMMATPVKNLVFDYDTSGIFYRNDVHDAPHNVILRAKDVVGQSAALAAPQQQWAYSTDIATSTAALDGAPTGNIAVSFSPERYPNYTWDEATKVWLRNQEGSPDLDANGKQLQATNVITMRVDIDGTYGEVPKTVLTGSGAATVSTGGKTVNATWSKADAGSPIRFVDGNGVVVRLAPGNTWIELVPNGTGSVTLQ